MDTKDGEVFRHPGKTYSRRLFYDEVQTETDYISKEDFIRAVNLRKKEKMSMRLTRSKKPPIVLIDLTKSPERNTLPRTPRTPCSMMSPLTSKFVPNFALKENDRETPPEASTGRETEKERGHMLSMMKIDLSSPLGTRLAYSLQQTLPKLQQMSVVLKNYEAYCTDTMPGEEELSRKLRSTFSKGSVDAYIKRHCHKNLGRPYAFSKRERKDRWKLLESGLNRESRKLLRRMPQLTVKLQYFPYKLLKSASSVRIDEKSKRVVIRARLSSDPLLSAEVGKPVYMWPPELEMKPPSLLPPPTNNVSAHQMTGMGVDKTPSVVALKASEMGRSLQAQNDRSLLKPLSEAPPAVNDNTDTLDQTSLLPACQDNHESPREGNVDPYTCGLCKTRHKSLNSLAVHRNDPMHIHAIHERNNAALPEGQEDRDEGQDQDRSPGKRRRKAPMRYREAF